MKLLEITADDAERWERKRKKKNPDTGFAGRCLGLSGVRPIEWEHWLVNNSLSELALTAFCFYLYLKYSKIISVLISDKPDWLC